MKASKFISILCAVSMMMSAGALSISASAENGTAAVSDSGTVPGEFAYFDGYMGDPEPFTKGIWLYTTKSADNHIVDADNLEGFFCFTSDSEGCWVINATGEVIPFTFAKKDSDNITFRFAGLDEDCACNITEKGYILEEDREAGRNEDCVVASISADGNTMTYTFNYGKPDAKEFLDKFYSDGMVPEELYETDGKDDTADNGMVPEELYETDGRDETANPGTGFNGFAAVMAISGASCAAAVAAYKFGKKK